MKLGDLHKARGKSFDLPEGLRWLSKEDLLDWERLEAKMVLDDLDAREVDPWDWGEDHTRQCHQCGICTSLQIPQKYRCRFSAAVELVHGFVVRVVVRDLPPGKG